MPEARVWAGLIFEDSGAICLARIIGNDGNNLTQAAVTGITYKIYDKGGTQADTGTLTVATVIFDTLQTDSLWTEDTTGYNFKAQFAASKFTTAEETYRVEVLIDPVSGEDFFVVWKVSTLKVLTS